MSEKYWKSFFGDLKSPGIDGFTVSWLREFWDELGDLITLAVNESLEKKELSHTLKTAIMRLLPKGAKSRLDPNNYRPISLLSIFYKIASGAVTRRVEKYYEKLVGSHQVAYSNKRNISSVPINVITAINFCLENNEEALVIACDFKKAFDSINQEYITDILKLLNFGPKMIGYINLFFNERNTIILLSGELGRRIKLGQSVPQGDCLSPTIFNIVVDPLLLKIIHSKNLKGIDLALYQCKSLVPHKSIEYRANSFADDSTVIIKPEERFLRYLVKTINSFTKISGLHANLNKTAVIPVGIRNWDESQIIAPDLGLAWTNSFTLLGYTIDNKLSNLNQNIINKMDKIKQLINTWKRRHLSIFGRINVAKGLLVSQLTYQILVVGTPPALIKNTEELILEYIKGDSKKKWLTNDLICTPKKRSGLGFFYLSHFYSAVQICFLKHYNEQSEEMWAKVLDNQLGFLPKNRTKLWKIGDLMLKKISAECKVQGIKHSLNSLAEFQKIFPTDNFKDNSWFLQPFFNNSNVKSFFQHNKKK